MDAPGRPRCWAGPGHQGARSPQASAAEPAMATTAGLSVRLVERRSVHPAPGSPGPGVQVATGPRLLFGQTLERVCLGCKRPGAVRMGGGHVKLQTGQECCAGSFAQEPERRCCLGHDLGWLWCWVGCWAEYHRQDPGDCGCVNHNRDAPPHPPGSPGPPGPRAIGPALPSPLPELAWCGVVCGPGRVHASQEVRCGLPSSAVLRSPATPNQTLFPQMTCTVVHSLNSYTQQTLLSAPGGQELRRYKT